MKKKINDKSSMPVDVTNDEEMVALGIRPRNAEPRDPSIWTKTDKEKKLLRRFRNRHYELSKSPSRKNWSIPLRTKIVINLIKNDKFIHSTYSQVCGQSDIPQLLKFFSVIDKKTGLCNCLVRKYWWNGKEYSPNELPSWGWLSFKCI